MTDTERIRAARELITDPSRWIQDDEAVDRQKRPVMPTSSKACAWCAIGALTAVCVTRERTNHVLETYFPKGIDNDANFPKGVDNDAHAVLVRTNDWLLPEDAHGEVLTAFDAAIAIAERDS